MENEKYLYGAAVQGIQGYIFQTNELKNIIGASELVERICKEEFSKFTDGKDSNSVLRAAGNIKHIFESEEDCKRVVREFPKHVMETAPGITISQAVVKMVGKHADFATAVNELEQKLRVQRNRPMPSVTTGLMGIKRSNKSGFPSVKIDKGEFLDAATCAKQKNYDYHILCDKAFGEKLDARSFAFDIKDITLKNDWISIIHADGNGLGQVVQKVGKNAAEFKEFSEKLDKATILSAQAAWDRIKMTDILQSNPIPIRPIVLGGDDLTVICRADFAIEYVAAFMQEFEIKTEEFFHDILQKHNVFENGAKKLTACAGVAFIKSSFPFYYGYELAEALCGEAKKHAKALDKNLAPSCLMFHKVQDSFVEKYQEIEKRELLTKGGVSFKYGPYYMQEIGGKPTVEVLLEYVRELDSEDGNKIKSHLRQWVSALIEDEGVAEQYKSRVTSLLSEGKLKNIFDKITSLGENKTMAYDILSLASIKFQNTKTK